jgi:hypothetical protein
MRKRRRDNRTSHIIRAQADLQAAINFGLENGIVVRDLDGNPLYRASAELVQRLDADEQRNNGLWATVENNAPLAASLSEGRKFEAGNMEFVNSSKPERFNSFLELAKSVLVEGGSNEQ